MSMLLGILMRGGQVGQFLLDLGDNSYTAIDTNGSNQSGTLNIRATGGIDFTGDALGNSESGQTWFDGPINGTWYCKINHLTGTNVLTGGSAEDAWVTCSIIDRSYTWSRASVGGPDTDVSTYDLAFSDDAGSTVFANETITINLQEQSP